MGILDDPMFGGGNNDALLSAVLGAGYSNPSPSPSTPQPEVQTNNQQQMQQLLSAANNPTPPPQPPPNVMANAGPAFAPNSVVGGGGLNIPPNYDRPINPSPGVGGEAAPLGGMPQPMGPPMASLGAAPLGGAPRPMPTEGGEASALGSTPREIGVLRDPMPNGDVGSEAASLGLGPAPQLPPAAPAAPESDTAREARGALPAPYMHAVKRLEGYTEKPAWDFKQWSSGYGTRASGPGDIVSKEEHEKRFQREMQNAADQVDAAYPGLPEGPRAALTSHTFNAGIGWMNQGLGAAVKAGDWNKAAQLLQQYTHAGGQYRLGLAERKAEEASWMLGADPKQGEIATNRGGSMGGGLATALGLPANVDPRVMLAALANRGTGGIPGLNGRNELPFESAMGALGKGLSAVGSLPRGAPAGQAFAAGAGGSLQGYAEGQRQRRNDLFNQTSTAFKDILAAEKRGDDSMLADAHARYWDSIAQARAQAARTGGRDVFSNTPFGRATRIEQEISKIRTAREAEKRQSMRLGTTNPGAGWLEKADDVKSFDAQTEKMIEGERNRQYQKWGIPQGTEKMGQDPEHAWDWDKLTPQQRLEVPEGHIVKFKKKDGTYGYAPRDYSKTPPYPGWQRDPSNQPQQQPQSPQQVSPQQVLSDQAAERGGDNDQG